MNSILDSLMLKIEAYEEIHLDSMTVGYMLLSSFCLSLQGFISKQIVVNSSQIVYFRALVMTICNTIPVYLMKIEIYNYQGDLLRKIYGRCIFGCIGTILFYQALKYISLSDGLVLFRTTPIWTSLMAVYYLKKEKFTNKLISIMAVSFIGIFLMIQPAFLLNIMGNPQEVVANHALGVLIMTLVAILNSTVQVLINQMAGELSQLVILQYFSVVSIILTLITNTFYTQQYTEPSPIEFIYLVLIGVFSYISQFFMNRSYMKGELTKLTLVGQTQIIFAVIFDVLSGHSFNLFSIIGGSLVIGSLVILIVQKKTQKPVFSQYQK